MTTPEQSALGDAAEADMVEQSQPIDDIDDIDDDAWADARRISEERDWQASEADLIEQATAVPADESDSPR